MRLGSSTGSIEPQVDCSERNRSEAQVSPRRAIVAEGGQTSSGPRRWQPGTIHSGIWGCSRRAFRFASTPLSVLRTTQTPIASEHLRRAVRQELRADSTRLPGSSDKATLCSIIHFRFGSSSLFVTYCISFLPSTRNNSRSILSCVRWSIMLLHAKRYCRHDSR